MNGLEPLPFGGRRGLVGLDGVDDLALPGADVDRDGDEMLGAEEAVARGNALLQVGGAIEEGSDLRVGQHVFHPFELLFLSACSFA